MHDNNEESRNDSSQNTKIKVTKDGPYIVTGNIPLAKQKIITDNKGFSLRWEEGVDYPDKEKYALCRCGQSSKKPYCDGTHIEMEFDGTETASREKYIDQAKRLQGPDLVLTDTQRLCASGQFCDRASGAWKLTKDSNNPNSREIAIQEACDCPSGRLVAWDKKTGQEIELEFAPSIGLVQGPKARFSGPIWVRGGITVEACDGTQYEVRNRVTLCRCGRSENKPFCDSTHVLVGFSDED
ncbi:MAG: iron-binding protein [Firmicutes bacterium HGW-Firmicutes-15]|nr:MAG: iron-binding protein [Firmicutes bacterium HGW-Firmicutes-15]